MSRSSDIIKKMPTPKQLGDIFAYIDDVTLRSNIVIVMRFVVFQSILLEEEKILGAVRYSICKSIVLHLASVAEAATHYCIQKLMDGGGLSACDIFDERWIDKEEPKTISTISDNEKVCASIRTRSYDGFRNAAQTLQINRAAMRAGIFDAAVHAKAESLRKKRNRIHLAGLEKVDDYYSKADINEAMRATRAVLAAIKIALKKSS